MTKNTKAKITLIFCINKREPELSKALDAIARQTDKNCNLIFVFNGSGQSEKDIFKKFEFKGFADINYVLLSENLGDSYAFKYLSKHTITTKYFYYFDANIVIAPDFVATLNNFVTEHPQTDVLSFFGVPNIYFKNEYITIKTLSDDFCNRPLVFFGNKLISLDYVKQHNIFEPPFKYYPTLYYVSLMKGNPKWYSLGRQICSAASKQSYSYNIFDLFDQCQVMVDTLDKKFFKEHYSEIEYLCVVSLFRNFIYAFFKRNPTNFVFQKRVLNQIQNFMFKNFPHWRANQWLYSPKNKNDKTYLQYLRDFKPKLIHVLRALYSKLFVSGHAKTK